VKQGPLREPSKTRAVKNFRPGGERGDQITKITPLWARKGADEQDVSKRNATREVPAKLGKIRKEGKRIEAGCVG